MLAAVSLLASVAALAIPATALRGEDDRPTEVRWYRGNTHAHSLWSDGNDFPEMIVERYVDAGYDFLAISDHNTLHTGERWMDLATVEGRGGSKALEEYVEHFGEDWVERRTVEVTAEDGSPGERHEVRLRRFDEYRGRFEKPEQFLLIQAEEISASFARLPIHINAINLAETLPPLTGDSVRDVIHRNLMAITKQAERLGIPIIAHINHPNFGWAMTAEDLAGVLAEEFIEVYNGHPAINHEGDESHPGVERLWDIANTLRLGTLNAPPLLGLGTDDAHHYHGTRDSRMLRGWIMVKADALSPEALIAAMRRGDFYATSGVTLTGVEFDGEELRLEIDAKPGVSYTTQFIGTRRGYDRTSEPVEDPYGRPLTRRYAPDVGAVLAEVAGTAPSYRLTGDELYVRAAVISTRVHPNPSHANQVERAWTQPVGWRLRSDGAPSE